MTRLGLGGGFFYLSLVAMDQHRVIPAVKDYAQRSRDLFVRHWCYGRLFIARHTDLEMGDAVLSQELGIMFRVGIRHQGPLRNVSTVSLEKTDRGEG